MSEFIPSAIAIVAFPDLDTDQWGAFYAFKEDEPNDYLLVILTDRNYEPTHDPYANHRSIASEFDGDFGNPNHLVNFAGMTGLPITFIPDVSPDR